MRNQAFADARRLVRALKSGVLSTISKNLQGYPFGSVTPFMSDSEGSLYIYISDIAQHAKNIREDARVSMTVYHQAERGDQGNAGQAEEQDAGPLRPAAHAVVRGQCEDRDPRQCRAGDQGA